MSHRVAGVRQDRVRKTVRPAAAVGERFFVCLKYFCTFFLSPLIRFQSTSELQSFHCSLITANWISIGEGLSPCVCARVPLCVCVCAFASVSEARGQADPL